MCPYRRGYPDYFIFLEVSTMEQYTINGHFIYYGNTRAYALDNRHNAKQICEMAQNIHKYLLDNADISLLENDYSIFDLLTFSCSSEEFQSVMDMFAELNNGLKVEPDEEDYFIFNQSPVLLPCLGDVLIKWDINTHTYVCYDMGVMDLQTLRTMLK
jgi:hypothetical protein